MQSLDELRTLRKNFPGLWQKLQEWELKTWRNFRADYSIQELDIRFELEEERLSKGLTINMRDKDFRNEFENRLLAFRK